MQPLTRLASRLGTTICTTLPCWRSELAALKYIPGQALTPRQEQRRYGYTGGERVDQGDSMLDPFLGRWVEVGKENYPRFLSAVGVAPEMHPRMEQTPGQVTFRRSGEEWEVETGYLNSRRTDVSRFHFGEDIHQELINGQPIKTVRYQDGRLIRERHVTYMGPKKMMTVVNEVIGDKLTITSRLRGVTAKVFYERSRS